MKHLYSYKELYESTSAGSQDRGSVDLPPFKFAINYDSRLGYTKRDFCSDLTEIYKGMTNRDRSELMKVIVEFGGVYRISEISNLSQETVDILIKEIETHMDSKSSHKMQVLPDGYILCYEDLKHRGRICDLYYSPFRMNIKISYTDAYPEMEDLLISLDKFDPASVKVDLDDFTEVRNKCDNFIGTNEVIVLKDSPDSYSL